MFRSGMQTGSDGVMVPNRVDLRVSDNLGVQPRQMLLMLLAERACPCLFRTSAVERANGLLTTTDKVSVRSYGAFWSKLLRILHRLFVEPHQELGNPSVRAVAREEWYYPGWYGKKKD